MMLRRKLHLQLYKTISLPATLKGPLTLFCLQAKTAEIRLLMLHFENTPAVMLLLFQTESAEET